MNKLKLFFGSFGLAKSLFRECRLYGDNPNSDHHDLYTHLLLWHMRCVFQPQHEAGPLRDAERKAEVKRFQQGLAHPKSLRHFLQLIDELLESAKKCQEMGLVYSSSHQLAQEGVDEYSALSRAIHNMQHIREMATLHPIIFWWLLLRG